MKNEITIEGCITDCSNGRLTVITELGETPNIHTVCIARPEAIESTLRKTEETCRDNFRLIQDDREPLPLWVKATGHIAPNNTIVTDDVQISGRRGQLSATADIEGTMIRRAVARKTTVAEIKTRTPDGKDVTITLSYPKNANAAKRDELASQDTVEGDTLSFRGDLYSRLYTDGKTRRRICTVYADTFRNLSLEKRTEANRPRIR